MWSRKRVLKKHKKELNKKRILVLSLISGSFGIVLIALGSLLVLHEPLFETPLPFLSKLGGSAEKDQSRSQIDAFLKKQQLAVSSIQTPNKHTYVITLVDNGEVVLSSEDGLSEQLSSLQRILARLTMEGKKFKRLDLRYDRPVIVLQ